MQERVRALCLAVAVFALAGCRPPQHFVLVHGAFMGAWAWEPVVAQLRGNGEKVTAIDLPAHGEDQTPVAEVTLDAYLDRVDQAVDAEGSRVVLVGHSMSGMVIAQYAERAPEKVKLLVYMTAYVVPDGKTMLDVGPMDTDSQTMQYLVPDPQNGTLGFPAEKVQELFCADCTASALQLFHERYRDDLLAPLSVPLALSEASWGSVPKAYIFASDDQAITLGFQQQMASTMTLTGFETLATSHLPQLSAPAQVAGALVRLAR